MPATQAIYKKIELTVATVADLTKYSARHVRRMLDSGELQGEKRLNERGRPAYYIPLSALEERLQLRYLKAQGLDTKPKQGKEPRPPKNFELFSIHEQEEISFWLRLLDEWQHYRSSRGAIVKAETDQQFVGYATVAKQDEFQKLCGREFTLSEQILYRRWRCFKDNDLQGLLDGRGKANKGTSVMSPVLWDTFLWYYLDQAQHPVVRCYKYTEMWAQELCPELLDDIPHISSFYRRIESELPEPLRVLGREGEKAYRDRCAPYIRRVYDDLQSNEYWVADTHTLDIISADDEGTTHRLYLVAFLDARSWAFMGCYIAEQPSSQATLMALRKGIQAHGIPDNIYVDNGREFLTHDVGGLGHRAKKKHKDAFNPPPVFERLGVKMTNALVRNARAKVIERRFRDVKDHISRLFSTYTGGNVVERPEQLKYNLKKGKIVADQELTHDIEAILEYYLNRQPYGGSVAKDKGKPLLQVYNENLLNKRVASEDDLNLLLMRSSRLKKVGRRGVSLKIGGSQIDYFNDDFVNLLFGQEVYFRYDPEDLRSVRVYDKEDRLLMIVPADNEAVLAYGANADDVKQAQKKVMKVERAVKTLLGNTVLEGVDRRSALELVMTETKRNEKNPVPPERPNTIKLHRPLEQPLYGQVVGIDIDRMIENAERKYQGGYDDE